jgi:hypothetical protein
MSQHEKGLEDCLFSRQDANLINVRFFRGSSDVISEDEFREELKAAAQRKRTGEVKATYRAPRCRKAPIDLRQFVANI